MSVLVFVEADNGQIKKSSLEAVAYGAAVAGQLGTSVTAVAGGTVEASALTDLGKYGASKVLHAADTRLDGAVIQATATLVAQAAQQENAAVVVMARSSLVDAIAASVGVKLSAAVATNVVSLPNTSAGFVVKRSIYTGKAFSDAALSTAVKVVTIKKNTVAVNAGSGSAAVEAFAVNFGANDFGVKRTDVVKATGHILLPEADKVVSGGRGLKGPENWHLVESLANVLGAGTACSKPVSDMDWRPHHEHVGQTGIKISPNLYIAIGISGAIQHLAGVNSSKVIVAINKDPEAPFFKAADYGIVGDAFEVVPKLTEAIKAALN